MVGRRERVEQLGWSVGGIWHSGWDSLEAGSADGCDAKFAVRELLVLVLLTPLGLLVFEDLISFGI